MPVTHYRVWGWGGSVGEGASGALRVGVAAIAKCSSRDRPFELVNEIICGDLGRALKLPIPPGFVIKREGDDTRYYASMNFAQAGQTLPPANATAIAKDNPELACGVILFDLWVANADRNDKNLSYDEKEKNLQLFDHGRALMGITGRIRLQTIQDQYVINRHCLAAEISTMAGFKKWSDRIKKLPEFFIEETVADAVGVGLDVADVPLCIDFLLKRRKQLLSMTRKYKKEFRNLDLFNQDRK
jgi:hypothetical protein